MAVNGVVQAPHLRHRHSMRRFGFTLIELSVVLVIIGLVVGGVLTGQDLIAAARVRAQIGQIEKYNAAANTFRAKYEALPGDLTNTQAAAYGFFARTGGPADGDRNGFVEACQRGIIAQLKCETNFFWTDLTAANLIEGSFTVSNDGGVGCPYSTDAQYASLYPRSMLHNENFVVLYGDVNYNAVPIPQNTFQIVKFSYYDATCVVKTDGAMTPNEAYAIDNKIDDGLPMTGSVQDMISGWLVGEGVALAAFPTSPFTDCIQAGAPLQYAVNGNTGSVRNCSISFKAAF
jgi:prepilin-type N-terminal cleavage/methylation domain-containing protein